MGAFNNFKAQEILPKGEIFHIQNPIKIGNITILPDLNTRVNDFWVEYDDNRIKQFYTNLSILNNNGTEVKTKQFLLTILYVIKILIFTKVIGIS